MRVLWFVFVGLLLLGCATQPILSDEDYTKYCTKPGVCETYLRAKMMQYQNIGPVVVGVMPV
ncbi:MAG: hypothetical protein ACR2P1_06300, partial [Pseudomonadales bacterium]